MDEPAQGWEPLREAIAQYLRRARGLAEPGQIAITAAPSKRSRCSRSC
ncbi:hypothetical protein [Paenibacillus mucilaginosus]|nr:hypothetical protein [Paenibacillus mucilaginosus]